MANISLSSSERKGILWLSIIVIVITSIAMIRSCAKNNTKQFPITNIVNIPQPINETDSNANSTIANKSKKKSNMKRKSPVSKKVYPTRKPLDDVIPSK